MGVPGSANALLLKQAAAAGGYEISRSVRLNAPDSAYLSRTPAVQGDRRTWTWAGWVKRSELGRAQMLFCAGPDTANDTDQIQTYFTSSDTFGINSQNTQFRITTQVFRDISAWYHFVIAVDTTIASPANDRIKLYINGSQVTTFNVTNNPVHNANTGVNATTQHTFGRSSGAQYATPAHSFSGYLAETYLIDAQALTPTSFTEVSATTGQLIPKAYSGSFGTNGFQLRFADNSSNTAATLGKDTSGNSNNWTPNNLRVGSGIVWSSYVAGTPYSSLYAASYAFDGFADTSHMSLAAPGTSFVFTPPSAIPVTSSLRIWGNKVGTGGVLTINGSDVTSQMAANSYQWNTITGFSSITSISWSAVGGNDCILIAAIEVDGSILIDATPADNDSLVDTPTSYGTPDTGVGNEVRGNYATLNPLKTGDTTSFAQGNLFWRTTSDGPDRCVLATIGMSSGKWYWECYMDEGTATTIGVALDSVSLTTGGAGSNSYVYYSTGTYYNSGSSTGSPSSFATGDLISVAFDADTGKLWFAKNGTWQSSGDPGAGTNPAMTLTTGLTYFPLVGDSGGASQSQVTANFGQRAFAYTAPSGFKALCDTNLPEPTIADGSTVMDVSLWTGNGTQTIVSGLQYSPDFVWIKSRSTTAYHMLFDVVRGAQARLHSNTTDQEQTGNNDLTSFNSDGYTLDNNSSPANTDVNGSGITYVGWSWDAGTSTVSNPDGSITSQVRANASAGFSVVSWTNGSNTNPTVNTLGHGLGVVPSLVIVKTRTSGASDWLVKSEVFSDPVRNELYLNTTAAKTTAGVDLYYRTSSVLGFRETSIGGNGDNMIAYCFAPVVGYSAALSWTGNGSNDGTMIYCGFSPRFWIWKRTDTTGDWWMIDTARSNTGNPVDEWLAANRSDAEYPNDGDFDFLSNGIKIRTTSTSVNASGGSYIGFAWASNPFQYARAQ
jgi:hypothetical protein